MKKFLAFVATLMMGLSVALTPADAATSMTAAEFLAVAQDGVITLTDDVTLSTSLVVNEDLNIDLAGKTLTFTKGDNHFNKNTVITNGTVSVDNVVASGDCIIGVGHYSTSSMKLEDVTFTGENYSSAYAAIYVYEESVLDVVNSVITLTNDSSSAGGAIKGKSGADVSTIKLTDTTVTLTDAVRGFVDGTYIITSSNVTMSATEPGKFDNGINGTLDVTVDNSNITISDVDGRALTLDGGVLTVTNNSTLNFSNCGEADIRMKKDSEIIVEDKASTITFTTSVLDSATTKTLEEMTTLPEGLEFKEVDGVTVIACKHEHTEVIGAVKPTCTLKGYTGDVVCTDCQTGLTLGEDIPATNTHTYENGVCKDCGVKAPVSTGDSNAIMLYAGLSVVAVTAMATLVLSKKKENC